MSSEIFKSNDGSVWRKIPASKLCLYPIWEGNRIIDHSHIKDLEERIGINNANILNSSIFRTITIWSEDDSMNTFIIDGQHRIEIIKKYLIKNSDFDCIVSDKIVDSEADAINYFKIINSHKNIPWKEDSKLIANKFVAKFEEEFNKRFEGVIKNTKTRKPYISTEKLRETLVKAKVELWKKTPSEFVEDCLNKNEQYLSILNPQNSLEEKAISIGFSLGCISMNEWI